MGGWAREGVCVWEGTYYSEPLPGIRLAGRRGDASCWLSQSSRDRFSVVSHGASVPGVSTRSEGQSSEN